MSESKCCVWMHEWMKTMWNMSVAMKLTLSTATRNTIYTVSNRSGRWCLACLAFYTLATLANVIQFIESFPSYSLPYQSINQLVRVLNIRHMLAVQFECCCCCCCYHFVSFIVGFVFRSCYGCSCSWRYSNVAVAVASGATPAASAELAPHFCPHLQVKWNYLFCVCVHMHECVCVFVWEVEENRECHCLQSMTKYVQGVL